MKNINICKKLLSLSMIFVVTTTVFAEPMYQQSQIEMYGPEANNMVSRVFEDVQGLDAIPINPSSKVNGQLANDISKIELVTGNNIGVAPGAPVSGITSKQTISANGNVTNNIASPNMNTTPTPIIDMSNLIISQNQQSSNTQNINRIISETNFTMKNTSATIPSISAPAFCVINKTNGHIYASKDNTTKYEPAGLSNLMTAYIATKYFALDKVLTVNQTAVKGVDKDAAIAGLNAGDTITLKDAIASMFVKGCVDSANIIAENVSGSINDFVELMNNTAKEMGLTNTNFASPSGINNNAQFTTVLDMSIVMANVCENKELVELLKLTSYKLPKARMRDELTLYSKNTQLSSGSSAYNADITCSRMGYNTNSRYCVTSMMNYQNNEIIVTILKANGSQFSDTKKLLEYGKLALVEDIYGK